MKSVILDKDGTLNFDVEGGYIHKVDDLRFIPKVIEGLKLLSDAGFLLIIITNQSGIGRGVFKTEDFRRFIGHECDELEKHGIVISGVYHCPHKPSDECGCRKPGNKLFERAVRDHKLDIYNTWGIGDQYKDLKPLYDMGCRNLILVNTGEKGVDVENKVPCYTAENMLEAAKRCLKWI